MSFIVSKQMLTIILLLVVFLIDGTYKMKKMPNATTYLYLYRTFNDKEKL